MKQVSVLLFLSHPNRWLNPKKLTIGFNRDRSENCLISTIVDGVEVFDGTKIGTFGIDLQDKQTMFHVWGTEAYVIDQCLNFIEENKDNINFEYDIVNCIKTLFED